MLLAADIHLSRKIWSRYPLVEGDSAAAFALLATAALPKEPVIIAGDLFDTAEIDGWQANGVKHAADIFNSKGCKVYVVQGQHDRCTGSPLCQAFGFEHIGSRLIEIEGLRVYGLDYCSSQELQERLAWVPVADLLVIHAAMKPFLGFEGSWQLDLKQLPTHVPATLAGDIHVRKMVRREDGHLLISPGSLIPCSLGEIEQAHGCLRLDPNAKKVDEKAITAINISVRDYFFADNEVNITEIMQSAALSKKPLKPVIFTTTVQDAQETEQVIMLPLPNKTKSSLPDTPGPRLDLGSDRLRARLAEIQATNPDMYEILELALTSTKEVIIKRLAAKGAVFKQGVKI